MNGWTPLQVRRSPGGIPNCIGMERTWQFDDGRAVAEVMFVEEARRNMSFEPNGDPLVLVIEAGAHSGRGPTVPYAFTVETGSTIISGSDFWDLARKAELFVETQMPILRAKLRAAKEAT